MMNDIQRDEGQRGKWQRRGDCMWWSSRQMEEGTIEEVNTRGKIELEVISVKNKVTTIVGEGVGYLT